VVTVFTEVLLRGMSKQKLIPQSKWFTILKPSEIQNHNRKRAGEILETARLYEVTDDDLLELIAEGFQCIENKQKRKAA
jgi:hypothetical protein